jgi:hypothetical protein
LGACTASSSEENREDISLDEPYLDEQEAWSDLRLPSARDTRKMLNSYFRRMFPEGHKSSLRPIIAMMTTPEGRSRVLEHEMGRYLEDVHPDAFELLFRYGEDFVPRTFFRPPKQEPKPKACFENAYTLMRATNMHTSSTGIEVRYVEGVIFGAVCDFMLHAWNTTVDSPSRALDWTFYSGTHWLRYYGVSVSESEYKHIIASAFPTHLGRNVTTLFTNRDFVQVRPHLEEVLERRKSSQAA